MADSDNDSASNDLPVPETMRIAALLAELMPSGGLVSGATADVTNVDVEEPSAALESPSKVAAASPAPLTQTPPPLPAVHSPPMSQTSGSRSSLRLPPAAAPVRPPSKSEFRLESMPPKAPIKQPPLDPPVEHKRPPSKAEFKLEAAPSKPPVKPPLVETPVDSKRKGNLELPKSAPESAKPKPEKPPKPALKDDDLIPLGDLSVGGYFSLVNWRNNPEQAKHPRRSDYGLDEQTLALARLNPFYVIGQPRRPETRSVANVLSEIVWE